MKVSYRSMSSFIRRWKDEYMRMCCILSFIWKATFHWLTPKSHQILVWSGSDPLWVYFHWLWCSTADPSVADTPGFYFCRMPEHGASIFLNSAQSGQEVSHRINNVTLVDFHKTTLHVGANYTMPSITAVAHDSEIKCNKWISSVNFLFAQDTVALVRAAVWSNSVEQLRNPALNGSVWLRLPTGERQSRVGVSKKSSGIHNHAAMDETLPSSINIQVS